MVETHRTYFDTIVPDISSFVVEYPPTPVPLPMDFEAPSGDVKKPLQKSQLYSVCKYGCVFLVIPNLCTYVNQLVLNFVTNEYLRKASIYTYSFLFISYTYLWDSLHMLSKSSIQKPGLI